VGEVIAAHAVIVLEVSDHGLDGGTAFGPLQGRMRRYAQIRRIVFGSTVGLLGPIRAALHPPTPAAQIKRAYKLRQQTVDAPGAWTARGSFYGSQLSADCR
jgi:hypothetical protein